MVRLSTPRASIRATRSEGRSARPAPSRFAQQRARAAEIDAIRIERPLTHAEAAEADNLAHRLYMREWRARHTERFGPRP